AERGADEEGRPPRAEQDAEQGDDHAGEHEDRDPHGRKLQVFVPTAGAAISALSIGSSSPLHQVSTRLVYQAEAGFSLCPPGYTPWNEWVPQSTTIASSAHGWTDNRPRLAVCCRPRDLGGAHS